MSVQGLEVIDHTVQLTHQWINDLRDRLAWQSSREAFLQPIEAKLQDVSGWRGADDVSAVFQMLNAKISPGEIEDVRAGLPQSVRDLWPI